MIIRLLLSVFIALFSITAIADAADSESGNATAAVRSVLEKAMEIQTRQDLSGDTHRHERSKLVRQLIADNFLASDMAKESLKENWDKLSPKERNEFQQLFSELFQDSYTRMVLNFLQKENIEYNGESPGPKGVCVKTVIMRANEHIPVDYHLLEKKKGNWLIRDVEIDGVSIVDNYRSSFRSVIQKSSFEGLLQKMRTQSLALRE
ncbi:MAG: phospholipid-binding protein MlaC [Syntrophobacteraceae bacterium]